MTLHSLSRTRLQHAFVAVIVGLIAVPTAMTGLFQSNEGADRGRDIVNLREKATGDISRLREMRRDYWDAVDVYTQLMQLGVEGLHAPDINVPESYLYYLNPANFETVEGDEVHPAAPAENVKQLSAAQLQYNELVDSYQSLLDGYINQEFCPGALKHFRVPGFYELCMTLVEERASSILPNIKDRQESLGFLKLGSRPRYDLRNRLKNLDHALQFENGTSIRPMTHTGRPRPGQYDNQ